MDADVIITGYVGTPVDYRSGAEGWRFADFRLACTPRRRTRDGEWVDEQTTWIRVSAGRALADNIRVSLHTGDPVIVVGKLRTQRYRSADGGERERLVLEAVTIGHDLTRGQSSFSKPKRGEQADESHSQSAPDVSEESDEVAADDAPFRASVQAYDPFAVPAPF